jgi:hypothetical protein
MEGRGWGGQRVWQCRCNNIRPRSPPLFARDAKNLLFAKNFAAVPDALVARNFLRICAHCAHRRGFATPANLIHLIEPNPSHELPVSSDFVND